MYVPDSSIGGTVRTRFGFFKLNDAPLEAINSDDNSIYDKQKRLLGEIDRFLVIVETKTITSKAIVTKVANYAIIVENNWIRKAQAQLDWGA
ncbi:5604_t:CDS:2, partial [Gigaspora margarita]